MKHKEVATCVSVYEDVFSADSSVLFLQRLEEEIKDEWSELNWDNSGEELLRTEHHCRAVLFH
jgi:hypothetical protein